jgi:predicted nuclease with TOPRIM domain
MEIEELTEELKRDAQRLKEEKIELVDFDRLEGNLISASEKLKRMKEKEGVAEKILKDFKGEIKRMAVSLSRLKGENSSPELIEKYLSNQNIGYEELCLLKRRLESEFNESFPNAPLSRSNYVFSKERRGKDRLEEYRV